MPADDHRIPKLPPGKSYPESSASLPLRITTADGREVTVRFEDWINSPEARELIAKEVGRLIGPALNAASPSFEAALSKAAKDAVDRFMEKNQKQPLNVSASVRTGIVELIRRHAVKLGVLAALGWLGYEKGKPLWEVLSK